MSQLFASGDQSIGASASVFPVNLFPGFIFFRIDWFDLLVVQQTLSRVQYHDSKASVLWRAAFMVQLSHLYMTTGKTTALTRCTFVGKGISRLF